MTRRPTLPVLSELKSASSPAGQVKALKDLKNELIGHEQKKKLWIGMGVLTPLARILASYERNGQTKRRDANALSGQNEDGSIDADETEVQFQTIIVLGSLAYAGPTFVAPIYAARLIPRLLSLLSPSESHPEIVLPLLRVLDTIADATCLCSPEQEESELSLSSLLYSQQPLSSLSTLLRQAASSPSSRQQIGLAASLICKTCHKEHQRVIAAQSGITEALATSVTNVILDISRYGAHAKYSQLAPVLCAAKATMKESKSRGAQFLNAPTLTSVFSRMEAEGTDIASSLLGGSDHVGTSRAYRSSLKNPDLMIPQVTNSPSQNVAISQHGYPPLGRMSGLDSQPPGSRSISTAVEVTQNHGLEYVGDDESPLIPLLVSIFRSFDDATRLAAVGLLVTLYGLGLTKRPKEYMFALLLVPSLVRMLDRDTKSKSSKTSDPISSSEDIVTEDAPEVLATLTNGCAETQNAAVDAGVIRKLSQLLKESFDPLPSSASVPMWNAESKMTLRPQDRDAASRLGPIGIRQSTRHILKVRESVFTALAAMASEKDEYRKVVIENGVVPFVIRTLKIEPVEDGSSLSNIAGEEISELEPEPMWIYRDVILAACGAARALSRSVSTLRTSLMDAGLPAPLFSLLESHDIDIQIAATGVLCNLVLKFSPMRDAIMDGGVLQTLCEQAQSDNAKLRLNSMWALKNIIAGASNSTKMTCLKTLGPGWLKQIVANDVEGLRSSTNPRLVDRDDGRSTPVSMRTPNAAGERVDLLNAMKEDSKEAGQIIEGGEDEDLKMSDSVGTLSKADRDRRQEFWASHPNGDSFLNTSNTDAGSYSLLHRAMSDELAIQKEGLQFIRNLICGEQSPEMIDHLFKELGQDQLFEMLATKLRPRVLNAFTRDRRSSENGVRHIQPHTEIVTSTCFTLVHIAGGHPKHRQLLISQTDLLRLLLPLFHHSCREIRVCLCWIVINVTWVEDNVDKPNAKARARELAKLGFVEKLDALEKDESLDCRERAKNARDQMKQLLHM